MQQISLFELWKKSIRRWNLEFVVDAISSNTYIATLSVPSWKFIVKYSVCDKIIQEFEILDYAGYMYITKGIIKNIKWLVQTIFKNL